MGRDGIDKHEGLQWQVRPNVRAVTTKDAGAGTKRGASPCGVQDCDWCDCARIEPSWEGRKACGFGFGTGMLGGA